MRKLNELFRALSNFIADPAAHVSDAWSTVKGAIDPKTLAGGDKTLRNAVVVIDNAVAAVVYFLKQQADEPSKPEAEQKIIEGTNVTP